MGPSQAIISKRGYLANILTIPPLIYPFQYNPIRLSDSKQVTWGKKDQVPPQQAGGGGFGAGASVGISGGGISGGIEGFGALGASAETLGRTFSKADFHKFDSEGDRTLSFQLIVDGRDKRPGEPARRRNEAGDILADLAILRSFVYPKLGELLDVLGAAFNSDSESFVKNWFNEPPTALLILGDLTVEGFVTDLRINETLFNADLDPVRAEVDITLIEKVDSFTFASDSVKRLSRTFFHSAIEDIGNVFF